MESHYVYLITGVVSFALSAWFMPSKFIESRVVIFAASSGVFYAFFCYLMAWNIHIGSELLFLQLGSQAGTLIEVAIHPGYMSLLTIAYIAIACAISKTRKIEIGKSTLLVAGAFLVLFSAISYFAWKNWHEEMRSATVMKQR